MPKAEDKKIKKDKKRSKDSNVLWRRGNVQTSLLMDYL